MLSALAQCLLRLLVDSSVGRVRHVNQGVHAPVEHAEPHDEVCPLRLYGVGIVERTLRKFHDDAHASVQGPLERNTSERLVLGTVGLFPLAKHELESRGGAHLHHADPLEHFVHEDSRVRHEVFRLGSVLVRHELVTEDAGLKDHQQAEDEAEHSVGSHAERLAVGNAERWHGSAAGNPAADTEEEQDAKADDVKVKTICRHAASREEGFAVHKRVTEKEGEQNGVGEARNSLRLWSLTARQGGEPSDEQLVPIKEFAELNTHTHIYMYMYI